MLGSCMEELEKFRTTKNDIIFLKAMEFVRETSEIDPCHVFSPMSCWADGGLPPFPVRPSTQRSSCVAGSCRTNSCPLNKGGLESPGSGQHLQIRGFNSRAVLQPGKWAEIGVLQQNGHKSSQILMPTLAIGQREYFVGTT